MAALAINKGYRLEYVIASSPNSPETRQVLDISLAELGQISAIKGCLEVLLDADFTVEEIDGCKARGVVKANRTLYDSSEKLECGMRAIVMECIPAKNLHYYLSQQPYETIHAEGLVFGDFRKPNVLVVEKGKHAGAMPVDFDWCSQHQKGRYPLGLNEAVIMWADGVKRGGAIDQKHDTDMLKLLFEEKSG
ncbi:hypothetical protein FRC10_000355 [Ceratobasidium sp. 414]|nr:hypothetical protein FRC10_000355 [Ceratobasidium sp. 414]